MRRIFALIVILVALVAAGLGQTVVPFNPTSTLTAETANNTSASDSFAGWTNGNPAPHNISKVSLRTLLPAGSTLPIYMHLVPWWGTSAHPNVGYSNLDPNHAQKMVDDLVARGIDGVMLDWYGKGSREDYAFQTMLPFLNPAGLKTLLILDSGILKWHSCYSTCPATQAVIESVTYLKGKYNRSDLMDRDGKILLAEFGMEAYGVDWNQVQAAHPDTLWLHRNTGGFSKAQSAGAYSWLATRTTDWSTYEGLGYLTDFYNVAARNPGKLAFGSVFKGFNDTMASWAPPGGRHIAQLCGKTWLDSWALAAQNAGRLGAIQVVTWDDYEEGSEVETGIDNCVAISVAVAGSTASWTLAGDPSTLDHVELFVSDDGERLMKLGEYPAADGSALLPRLLPGTYTIFARAVGKPFLFNQMSAPDYYKTSNNPPTVTLAVSMNQLAATAEVVASDPEGDAISTVVSWGDGIVDGARTHVYAVAGVYNVVATTTDEYGAQSMTQVVVTAALPPPPPPPVKPVVVVSSPADGFYGAGPSINLKASASSANGAITAFKVYVNSVEVQTIRGVSSFQSWVPIPKGKVKVTVNAWDKTGACGVKTIYVTRTY